MSIHVVILKLSWCLVLLKDRNQNHIHFIIFWDLKLARSKSLNKICWQMNLSCVQGSCVIVIHQVLTGLIPKIAASLFSGLQLGFPIHYEWLTSLSHFREVERTTFSLGRLIDPWVILDPPGETCVVCRQWAAYALWSFLIKGVAFGWPRALRSFIICTVELLY